MSALLFFCAAAVAQTPAHIESAFEGKRVTVKIDMPATKYGIDVFPGNQPSMNYDAYAKRLKQFGTSLREGEQVLVTRVKVKKDVIEFQLGGGGYGTLGDEGTSVSVASPAKTQREKNLERDLKSATDPAERRRIREELDDLQKDRQREEAHLRAIAAQAAEFKQSRIREQARTSGSRFNVRYDGRVPPESLTEAGLIAALAEYVDFSGKIASSSIAKPAPEMALRLRKGMTQEQVEEVLGYPRSQKERMEGKLAVTTCTFDREGRNIEAEFVNEVMIRYSITEQ